MPLDKSGKETGWISKWAFQAGGMAADSVGRAAMADLLIQNGKIDNATITASKLAAGVLATGVYGLGKYGVSLYG